jgi:hypothetical protein
VNKVRVFQFQSIKDSTLELEGFVTITGPSNRGKSALIRAIEGCWFGILGDYYVRRGENKASVIWLTDKVKLRWQKIVKKRVGEETYLEVNGTKYTKLGREHGDLTEKLGFVEIEASGARLRPQVAKQHDPIFLLTENETVAAEIFKLLGRVDVVVTAQQMARSELTRDNRTLVVRKGDVEKAEEELRELDRVPELRNELDDLELDLVNLELQRVDKYRLLEKIEKAGKLGPEALPSPPEVEDPDLKTTLLWKLERCQNLRPATLPVIPTIDMERRREKLVLMLKTQRLLTLTSEYYALDDEVRFAEGAIETWEKELEALKKELGVCPLCKREFDEHRAAA